MRVAAVGAGDLLDAACLRLFRVAQQIEFELFAALAAFDVHVQRAGNDLAQIAEEHAEFPLLQLHIAEALHLSAAGGTGFLAHKRLLSVKNALRSNEQRAKLRGTTSGSPPSRKDGLHGRTCAPRDNGRTRLTPYACAVQGAAPGGISSAHPCRLTPSGGSLKGHAQRTRSLQRCNVFI